MDELKEISTEGTTYENATTRRPSEIGSISSGNAENVKVSLRVRPFSKKESEKGCTDIVKVDQNECSIEIKGQKDKGPKLFTFDTVFPVETTQAEVYNQVARPIIEYVLQGYNGTIFAYGQTGTGKTYTMEGDPGCPELKGIIPNSFAQIFSHIAQASDDTRFLVRVSYLEIYQEDVRDLLAKDATKKLEIKERKDTGVYVRDLSSFVVRNEHDMAKIMSIGNKNRSVGSTNMNIESSRSHAIFSITVECSTEHDGSPKTFRMGKLNLVDLAGSERISKTGATGQRLKEGSKINLSLSNLGNVISALVEGQAHVPYRNSKLTRLLQDSLGGNSKTVMIANIGPADYNYEETINTLRYADRAKQIKNYAKINEDPKDALLRQFENEIEMLRKKLEEESDDDGSLEQFTSNLAIGESNESDEEDEQEEEPRTFSRHPDEQTLIGIKDELESQEKINSQVLAESEHKKTTLSALKENVLTWKQHQEKKSNLQEKLNAIQKKIMVGGENLLDKSQEQEEFLQRAMVELSERKKTQEKLHDSLKSKIAEKLKLENDIIELQGELATANKQLRRNLKTLEKEKYEDSVLMYEEETERAVLLNEVKKAYHENQFLSKILEQFVPPDALGAIESSMTYNKETSKWNIPGIAYAGNHVDKVSLLSDPSDIRRRSRDRKERKNMDFLLQSLHDPTPPNTGRFDSEGSSSKDYLNAECIPTTTSSNRSTESTKPSKNHSRSKRKPKIAFN